MDFVKDYGLLLVTVFLFLTTFWYSLATSRMARVMTREIDLKTKPQVGLAPPIIKSDGWVKLEIAQEMTNVGFAYLSVEKAELSWWPFQEKVKGRIQAAEQFLPAFIAPADRLVFTFEVGESALQAVDHGTFASASELITGDLRYEVRGVEGLVVEAVFSLPSLE